jgi:hypothetical protein
MHSSSGVGVSVHLRVVTPLSHELVGVGSALRVEYIHFFFFFLLAKKLFHLFQTFNGAMSPNPPLRQAQKTFPSAVKIGQMRSTAANLISV